MTDIDRHLALIPKVVGSQGIALSEWSRLGVLTLLGHSAPPGDEESNEGQDAVPSEGEPQRVSTAQLGRLSGLATRPFVWTSLPTLPDMLFEPQVSCALGTKTCLVEGDEPDEDDAAASFLLQLLPVWADAASESDDLSGWMQSSVGRLRMYTVCQYTWRRYEAATARMKSMRNSRAAVFAKSASYMGSKASLSGQLCEVLHEFETPDTVVVDLMCGSGAMSGAFAKSWRTIASDAQMFSCSLAQVQGGGMNPSRAIAIADAVLDTARSRFDSMPPELRADVNREDEFMHKELSDSVFGELVAWLGEFDHARGDDTGSSTALAAAIAGSRLFSSLYANLFFGVRQAYEIDCLRFGIDRLLDPREKEWALGALVCAASQCAFSYGGHFAQPKLDVERPENVRKVAAEMLQKRSLSVSHEFYSRLVSLAEESQSVAHEVEIVQGPWQMAIEQAQAMSLGKAVCVYLDPPYTRDEYSRYYHVLETLVRYESGPVSGKGRLPTRGSSNRFASPFHSRNPGAVEDHIASILDTCLANGWSCLWSYSSSGMASIARTLEKCRQEMSTVELFSMDHTYKAQGKRGAKRVTEYAIYLRGAR